jgi:hypothetical protein
MTEPTPPADKANGQAINDQDQSIPTPATWPAFIWTIGNVLSKPRALAVVGFLLFFALLVTVLAGLDVRRAILKALRLDQPSPPASGVDYSSFKDAAEKADRPYMIEAATMVIDIEDVHSPTVNERRESMRVTYTVRALKDISRNSPVFTERYDTELAKEVSHWNGTEEERWISPRGSEYSVIFDMKQGELKTFTTGIDMTYQLPLPNDRQWYGKFKLGQNQDYALYEVGDFICNLNIIVRSKTTPLQPLRDDFAVKFQQGKDPEFEGAKFSPAIKDKNGWHTLSASWSFIKPGEGAAVIFQWP